MSEHLFKQSAFFYGRIPGLAKPGMTRRSDANSRPSLSMQEYECREFAEKHGIVIEDYFCELDSQQAGTKLKGFNDLILRLQHPNSEKNECLVLCHSMVCLGPSNTEIKHAIDSIQTAGGKLVICRPGTNVEDAPHHRASVVRH